MKVSNKEAMVQTNDNFPTHYAGQRIYTGDEVRMAFFLGGLLAVLITLGAAYGWSFYL